MNNPCKICGAKTTASFNINFKAVPICEHCATTIFVQQALWYTKTNNLRDHMYNLKDKLDNDDRFDWYGDMKHFIDEYLNDIK